MERWINGRRELVEHFEKFCNDTEQNLIKELVDGDNTIIRKDELEKLRLKANISENDQETHAAQVRSNEDSLQEKGLRIKILEEEISRLNEELRSSRDAASRAERLDEENKRLAEELKNYQNVASRVGDLRQNRKLSWELSKAALRARDAEPSSTDHGQVPSMGRQFNYKELLNEHMRVKEQWSTQKERADKLVETLREKNAALRQWKEWSDAQQVSSNNKAGKSNAQAQEIQKLRFRSQESEGSKAPTTRPMLKSDLGDSVLPPLPFEVSVTSPANDPQEDENCQQPGEDGSEYEQNGNEQAGHESPQLPRYRRRVQRVSSVEETPLPIEPHHSSSTQDPESSQSGGVKNAISRERIMVPSSDGGPEFIYARPVRKRKRKERESQETPMPKIKVEELSSSSPISRILPASESLDLDEIGDKVMTPRKRRRKFQPFVEDHANDATNDVDDEMLLKDKMDQINQAPTLIESEQPRRAMITPASKRGKSSAGTPLQPLSTNNPILQNTGGRSLSAKRQRKPSAIIRGAEEILQDGESISPAKTPGHVGKGRIHSTDLDVHLSSSPPTKIMPYPTPQSAAPEGRSVILPPPKPSTEITTDRLDQRKIFDNDSPFSYHREDIDRQDIQSPIPTKRAPVSNENEVAKRAVTRSRSGVISKDISRQERSAFLSNEGDETSKKSSSRSRPSAMGESPTPSLRDSGRGSKISAELSPERTMQTSFESTRSPKKSTPKVRLGTSKPLLTTKRIARSVGEQDLDSDDPEKKPYRLLPVTTLKLHHFKINPNFNQGHNYAYAEVVRGKARQCLPGCVREACCGKQLGALAQALYPVRDNPTVSEKADEDTLLEEYLGDNQHKIWSMGKQERQETLAQARKWKISNTMGKHRSVVPRRNTPPGFWEADFPNTQEDEELRKKQKEIEGEKVAERYAEAMRPGGVWLFKDE
ncbi:hypothetical protein DSL72_006749 [Monilinia vaccinii-corymbosi]|uniref:DNA endonuclease activator Ctp1 C-terminal domain-containing protein n=1 Tax=Monilinia vaccinii-corymbosi TaxID=61207 RepID=A0A8A3PPX6_9HELO|nr:hypothetical protein DSL72_006749 [Monilinia vaccinii-corymbosi]